MLARVQKLETLRMGRGWLGAFGIGTSSGMAAPRHARSVVALEAAVELDEEALDVLVERT